MIEGLDKALDGRPQAGLAELSDLLGELLGGHRANARLVEPQMLRSHAHLSRVFRLRFATDGQIRSMIVKRLKPENTRRSELAARRWLPAIGLGDHGPALLGSVTEPSGHYVWHVYEDLGDYELDSRQPDLKRVRAAIELVVKVHTRFAGHPLLGEVRLHGKDLGIHFFDANVRDAILALEACQPPAEHKALHKRLLQRLYRLREEFPARAQAFEKWCGPETLLHGDLWPTNVFVIPGAQGFHARLIDWDLSGIGPACYDLATFLLRFEPSYRPAILDTYTEGMARLGWRMPPVRELNFLFETTEYARFANRVIWPAIALAQDHSSWGWDELAMVDEWFENLRPVLALEPGEPAGRAA